MPFAEFTPGDLTPIAESVSESPVKELASPVFLKKEVQPSGGAQQPAGDVGGDAAPVGVAPGWSPAAALASLGSIFFLSAMNSVSLGSSLPKMRDDYGVNDAQISFVLTWFGIGGVAGIFGAVLLAVQMNRSRTLAALAQYSGNLNTTYHAGALRSWVNSDPNRAMMVVGVAIGALAALCQAVVPVVSATLSVYFANFFFMSFSISVVAIASTCITAQWDRVSAGALSLLHFSFGVGAVLTPMFVEAMPDWNSWYFVSSITGFALALATIRVTLRPSAIISPAAQRPARFAVSLRQLARERVFWYLCGCIFFYMGAEMGVSSWVSTLMDEYGRADLTELSTTVFWAGELCGRAVLSVSNFKWSVGADEPGRIRIISVSMMCAVIINTVLMLVSPGVAVVFVFLSGLACSACFPLLMNTASARFVFPESGGPLLVVAGLSLSACVAVSVLMPIQGAVGSATSVRASLMQSPICAALLVVLLGAMPTGQHKFAGQHAQGAEMEMEGPDGQPVQSPVASPMAAERA
jgi:fucose permease